MVFPGWTLNTSASHNFCYNYGRIGHDEDSCKTPNTSNSNEVSGDKELGPRLRASFVGRQVVAGHSHSKSNSRDAYTQKSKENMSRDVIALLSALKVSSDPPHSLPPVSHYTTCCLRISTQECE
ncbi:hypothetical protein SESBI_06675 [Sesbania bispinosa]|nr:hypothetical protein SESBI_06675 [Sesbania bispinosa]